MINQMKLKPNILDYILLRYKRFDKVISIRMEIESMILLWENLDVLTTMKYPDVSTYILIDFQMMTFNEVACYRDKGITAVLERLKKDRKRLHEFLSQVPEINLNSIKSETRLRKLEELGI